jgi:uncharacterized protein with HEPN domain
MPHSVRKLLLDITISCEEISAFIANKSFADFIADRILQLALERQFEIIGEAVSRLSKADPITIKERIPEYEKIVGFRNVISHGYDVIDQEALWDFALNAVPILLQKVKTY